MSHRAAFLVEKGSPLVVKERPTPAPRDDQLLVKLRAVGVNVIDTMRREIGLYIQEFPTIIGNDGAGIVERVGKDVTKFKVGDRVVFEGLGGSVDEGVFQEYALVQANLASKIPSTITDVQAATLPTASAASFIALFGETGAAIKPPFNGPTVSPGSSIVILGGAGSVGQAGIQFARMAGFDTIITTAAKVHEESLKKLGATHVLDRHSTVDAKTIQKIASNVTLVYDTVCNENTTSLSISILATGGGTIARTSPYEGADLPPTISSKFIVGIFHYNAAGEGVPFYAALEKWLADGTLKPNETEVFEGIERADEAVTRLSKGVNRKKVVVKFT